MPRERYERITIRLGRYHMALLKKLQGEVWEHERRDVSLEELATSLVELFLNEGPEVYAPIEQVAQAGPTG